MKLRTVLVLLVLSFAAASCSEMSGPTEDSASRVHIEPAAATVYVLPGLDATTCKSYGYEYDAELGGCYCPFGAPCYDTGGQDEPGGGDEEDPGDGSGGGSWSGGSTAPSSQMHPSDEGLPPYPPDCSKPQSDPRLIAYCAGRAPSSTELEKLNSSLERLRAKSVTCGELADAVGELLEAGQLIVFTQTTQDFGAAAPIGGDWAIIGHRWFTDYETTKTPDGLNLDGIIAHEMDHLLNNKQDGVTDSSGHLLENGVVNKHHTLNSRQCS